MGSKSMSYYRPKLFLGLALRCPNCGQGKMFDGLFKMNPTCPYCHVRYERRPGESVGGMYINLGLAEVLSLGGFFIGQFILGGPLIYHIVFWVLFNIAFVVLFYRHSRGLWVAFNYLVGSVHPDSPYQP